jgi:hypothetical protein
MQIKNQENKLYEDILYSVHENMSTICSQKEIDFIFEKVGKSESFLKSICLMPYWFYNCFEEQIETNIESELFTLSKANLQAWISYTLYDYLRDGKIDKKYVAISISIANILIQKTIRDFYDLVHGSKEKMDIIYNLLSKMDKSYRNDNMIVSDTYDHFKYMCDNAHQKSIGIAIIPLIVTWLLGEQVSEKNHFEIINFFKNYLNARQLSDDKDDMVDDILKSIYTPATFLMKTGCNRKKIQSLMQEIIDNNMKLALNSLHSLYLFNSDRFAQLYIKEC